MGYPHQQNEHNQREYQQISNSKSEIKEGATPSDPIQPKPTVVPSEGVSTIEVKQAVRDVSAPKSQCAKSCCESTAVSNGKQYTYSVPKVPKQKYKSWGVQIIPMSEKAKKAVR